MSRDQYSITHTCDNSSVVMNDYCDMRGSIYLKIKIMAVCCQIHHAGHTLPRNHDLPHWCDFPDARDRYRYLEASFVTRRLASSSRTPHESQRCGMWVYQEVSGCHRLVVGSNVL